MHPVRHVPRWLVFALVVVVLVAGGLLSLGTASVRRPLPQLEGEATLPGLNGRATVLREDHGVPQVYADQPEDLFEAQGYVAASDRFFEMDVRRHAAEGRLAELFGPSQVATDTFVRTVGFQRTAEAELAVQSPSTRRYLDAYASGVNAYLRGRSPGQVSLEYSLLALDGVDQAPEEWTAVDSLAVFKTFGWLLSSNLDDEVERALDVAAVGEDLAADLTPAHPLDGHEPIVDQGTVVGKAFRPDGDQAASAPGGPAGRLPVAARDAVADAGRAGATLTALFGTREGIGSNSWVVSGARTANGAPMLSNDPHLATSIPSPLAQVGLHCTTVSAACPFDVTGYSITGVPGVVIGRNASAGWGLTTSYADVQDLYLEDVAGDRVRVGTREEPLSVRTEELKVAGEDPRTITIRSTRHGPLLSDANPDTATTGRLAGTPDKPYAVALAWTGSIPGRSMDAILAIDTATDWNQFRSAAALLGTPSQNIVYADVHGTIGYQLAGQVPRRARGDGRSPLPGWDTGANWKGLVPFAELPYVRNPASGVVVAANNQVIGDQYPYVIGSAYSYGWRSQELNDRLRDVRGLTPDQGEQLFYDDRSLFAATLVPELLKIKVADGFVREGQQTLVGWDYRMAPDSAAAAYFAVVVHDLRKLVLSGRLPPERWPDEDQWSAMLDRLLLEPDDAWWDDPRTPRVEHRDDVLLAGLTLARKEATSLMSRDPADWAWGRIHRVRLRSTTFGTSGIAPLEALFNREDDAAGGGGTTVKALGGEAGSGYGVTLGSAMRMLVDLGDADGGRWVNQSGASGHPFGPYYEDQAQLWLSDRTWPMVTTRNAVAARTRHTLVLKPDG
ncbi:penicillin amidase [Microlunatus flavus]|uniref:Penicillin amidase n=1 Tax=Microlunatus flavus TaxID=1036181 RepID=A0A1H9K019_9ACTN|nr:penicillin amidase [Microlunatus flavus]